MNWYARTPSESSGALHEEDREIITQMSELKANAPLDLSIVIVSYNVWSLLEECLHSIYRTTKKISFEVIVADNHSTDGSPAMIRRNFPEVILIECKENVGFARANNMGFRVCRGKCILMLNPDTVVLRSSLGETIDLLEDEPRLGGTGCKLLNPDQSVQPSCYRFPNLREISGIFFTGGRIFGGVQKYNYESEHEVDFVRGAFLALNRKCLAEIGLLDENFFLFGEEADLCYRMKESGWKVLYRPDSVVIHHKGKSTEQVSDKMYEHRMRSLLYFFRKHYGRGRTTALRILILLGIGLRLALGPVIKSRVSQNARWNIIKMALGLEE